MGKKGHGGDWRGHADGGLEEVLVISWLTVRGKSTWKKARTGRRSRYLPGIWRWMEM